MLNLARVMYLSLNCAFRRVGSSLMLKIICTPKAADVFSRHVLTISLQQTLYKGPRDRGILFQAMT